MTRALAFFLSLSVGSGLLSGVTGCDGGRGATSATMDLSMPVQFDLSGDPVESGKAVVYAHTADQLFSVDPDTLTVTLVAAFGWPNGADDMYDIAIDKNGKMIGITSDSVYSVDVTTAKCKYLAPFKGSVSFNGLSYISADQVDNAGAEILVGADSGGDLWEVSPVTGNQKLIGNYGSGWKSSGDLVSVSGATYATVNTGLGTKDTLVSVDAKTGKATKIGDTGYAGIYGLGYWKQKLFGFSTNNEFLLIDITTGKGTKQKVGLESWNGAGVTTAAPTIN